MNKFIKSTNSIIFLVAVNVIFSFLGFNSLNYLGIPLIILGCFIYFYNRHLMGKTWSVNIETKNEIIIKGLFKHVRHPLYLGALTACVGGIIFTNNLLWLAIFVFFTIPFTYYRARIEEKLLLKTLKGYKDYMKRTKMFFPKIL